MPTPTGLIVIWSTADRTVALHSAIMYARNSKTHGWWENVRFLIWGPSAQLLADDAELQQAINGMIADGVEVSVCKACADRIGVGDQLTEMGYDVFYVGELLTESLKAGWVPLTY